MPAKQTLSPVVVKVDAVRPHPNADNLVVAFVAGRRFVAATQYGLSKGALAVFIPAGSELPAELREALGALSTRVRRAKVRGEESVGILAPLTILPARAWTAGTLVGDLLGIASHAPEPAKRRARPGSPGMSGVENLLTLAEYPAGEILDDLIAARANEQEFLRVTVGDQTYRVRTGHLAVSRSQRYRVFHESCACVTCGLVGTIMALQRHHSHLPDVAHFNLYAVTETGERVLMTKDHIVPRSRGGANQHENYQTMCIICNQQKADGTPEGA